MPAPLDLDQLQTFCAIADCGSFTEAAKQVHKTQSAVSMQIKRLEERLCQELFLRDGRHVVLTDEGEALYSRARRMLKINAEILDLFLNEDLSGTIRFGVPDDYAVKLLPSILSSFQRTHPRIVVDVSCQPSELLLEGIRSGRYDIVCFTQGLDPENGELFRIEPMYWVASHNGAAMALDPLPLATGQGACCWRADAIDALNRGGRNFRVAYTSNNATAIASAVLADLAIATLPESALQPGMRIINDELKMPLKDAHIALMRASHAWGGIFDALASHIKQNLGNLEAPPVEAQQAAE